MIIEDFKRDHESVVSVWPMILSLLVRPEFKHRGHLLFS